MTTDIYGAVPFSGCGTVTFSVDFNIPTEWEGSGNMDASDECASCNGDPANQSPDCLTTGAFINGCWDFLWVRFFVDGVEVGGDLIGDAGTTNAEMSGTISFDYCASGIPGNASITINTQTWASNETITFSNVIIECIENPPTLSTYSVCEAESSLSLPSNISGIPGTWSGTSVSGNSFDPSIGPGNYNITFNPNPGTCASPASTTVMVTAATNPNVLVPPPLCETQADFNLPVNVSGIDGTWSGPGVTGNTFDPNAPDTGPGSWTLVFTPDPGECANTADVDVTVTPAQAITLTSPTGPFCNTEPAISLTTSPSVPGTWSGTGVTGNTFDPAIANIGSNNITFTPSGSGCFTEASYDFSIEVQSGTPVSLDPVGPVCILDSPLSLSPTQSGVSGAWSGDGVSGNVFNPAVAGTGNTTLTFSPSGGGSCTAPATTTVTVQAEQAYAPLPPPGSPFCESSSAPVSLTTTFNGVSGSWNGPGVSGGNTFTPSVAGTGNLTLTFDPEPGACASSETVVVEVQPEQIPILDDLGGPFCPNDGIIPLSNTQSSISGTWSGPGVAGSNFDPAQANTGNNTLTFTPAPGTCAATATTSVFVNAGPTPNPPSAPILVCIESVFPPLWTDNLTDIINQINGGTGQDITWYLDAAGTNEIDPVTYIPTVIASGATQTIYATVTDASGCESATVPVPLTLEVVPEASPVTISECAQPGGTVDLTVYNNEVSPGSTVFWYQDAGAITPVANPSAFPAVSGGSVWATASGGLCESDPVQVTFNLTPQPVINPIIPVTACGSYTLPPISGSNLSGGAAYYSDPNGTGASFSPGQTITASGTYYAYDSAAPGCEDEMAFQVTIAPAPDIFPPASPVTSCGPYLLPAITGTGLTGNQAYYTNPNGVGQPIAPGTAVTTSGTYYLYDGTPGCDDQETLEIIIQEPPVLFPVSNIPACDNLMLPPIQGNNLGGNAFYYTGPNATGNVLMPGDIVTNSQPLYIYAGTPGCSDETSFTVIIDYSIEIQPLPDQTACNAFTFPSIEGDNLTNAAAYFDGPNGTGQEFAPGDMVTTGGTFYIFDENLTCTDEEAFELTVTDEPVLSCAEGTPASGLGNADGIGSVAITGGSAPFLVEWAGPVSGNLNTSDANVLIDNLQQGAYSVTVTDDNGCSATCTFAITAPDCVLNFDFDVQGATCPSASDGAAALAVTGGDGNYTYSWSNMVTGSSIVGVLPGAYTVTVTDGTGCQSEGEVTVDTLNPAPGLIVTAAMDTICESSCVDMDFSFMGTPPFNLSYEVHSGTDTLTFDIFSTIADTTVNFCPSDSLSDIQDLIWQFGAISDAICADTSAMQDTIVVQPAVRDTLTETLCPGDSLIVNGTVYDASNPMGADTLTAAATGCDSIVVVMIDFFPVDTNFIVQTLCTGSSLTVNGTVYDEGNSSGFEVIPNGTINGCDSLISINLSFEDMVVNDIVDTLCPGGSLTVNGTLYDALNPSGADTLINGAASGCDSIITVTLDFYPADTNFIVQTICTGSSLTVNGTVYDEGNPTGFEVIPNGTTNGCDSLISIGLSFEDAVVNTIAEALCPGDSLLVNGTLYDAGNLSGSDTIVNGSVNGCDSIINVSISYWVADTNFVEATLCPGDTLVLNGNTYGAANPTGTEILPGGAGNGCDSVIVVDLAFFPADTNFIVQALCAGEALSVNGTVYEEGNPSGFEVIPNGTINGCDSLISINLSFEDAVVNDIVDTLCPGDSLLVNGTLYDADNPLGADTLVNGAANGCDSIINVTLDFYPADTNFIVQTLCTGGSLTVNGTVYDEDNPAGFEVVPNGTVNGCDSLISIDLIFEDAVVNDIMEALCPGESLVVNGTLYDETNLSGSDTILNGSVNGCDSIINVSISYLVIDTNFVEATLCPGDTLVLNVNTYGAANPTGMEILPGVAGNGCDSVIVVDLAFFPADTNFIVQALCAGEALSVNGTVYDEGNPSGFEVVPNGTVNGCDSLISIDLSFEDAVVNDIVETLCPGESLTVNGTLYDADNPLGADTLVNSAANGCDSIINVTLDFYPADTNFIVQTLCTGSSLTVNGTVYDEGNPAGFEVVPNGTVNGCDSLISIELTFEDAVVNTIAEALCPGDSLMVNGVLYDQDNLSGSDTLTGAAQNGCDSIINVSVSYLLIDTNFIVETLCFGESLVVNGTPYGAGNLSGTQRFPGAAANGCDSIINISVEVLDQAVAVFEPVLCPGESLTVNGVVYDELNPIGQDTLFGAAVNGCDSILQINLSFDTLGTNMLMQTLCPGETLTVNGTVYDESNPSGSELLPGAAANGCDSLITVALTFLEADTNQLESALCPGESLTINGTLYDAANPAGFEVIPGGSENGCDSLISVALTFGASATGTLSPTLCPGGSATVGGTVYDAANPTGTEILPGAAANGCDSTVNITLSFFATDTTQLVQTLCAGEGLTVNGTVYDASNPTGLEILPNANVNGCDSLVQIDLSFEEAAEGTLALSLCEGASVEVNGMIYDETNPNGAELLPGAAENGCDSLVLIDLIFQPVVTAELSAPGSICPGDSFLLTIDLMGADSFDFNLNDDNGVVEAFTGVGNTASVIIAPAMTATYSLTNLSGTGNFCPPILPEPLTIEVVQIEAALTATTGYNGFEVSCAAAADGGVEVVASGGTPPYAYQWSNGAVSSVLDNLTAGNYTVTINDTGGCESEASIELSAPSGILLEAAAVDANCLQENSGQIIIDTILGGLAPYQYQLNDFAPVSIGALPVLQDNLAAGTYELLLTDANGCQVSQALLISPASPLLLDLGEDKAIRLGESVQLSIDGQNFDIAEFTWQPDTLSDLEPVVMPRETTTYRLTARDAAGCSATDFITVIVEKARSVYAPNIFSPNGDGSNDFFTLFAGPDVVSLNRFRIFDRWGEQVFEGAPQALNNELLGWDGNHKGQPMGTGVFVFYAEVEFVDGHVEMVKGDFVLMR